MACFLRSTISRRIFLFLGFCLTLSLGGVTPSHGEDHSRKAEYLLKAAFLFNFAKFSEWPAESFPDPQAPFVLCTIGNDPFGPELDHLAGKVIRERHLVINRVHSNGNLIGCHLLYVSPGELVQMRTILRTLQKAPVLTVCDVEGCAEDGLMLNMRMVENRVALDLNFEAVQRTPLKLSSQLIKLTRIVKGQP